MALDPGWPRVLHRPIRAAGALRNVRCGKLCGSWARHVKHANCLVKNLSEMDSLPHVKKLREMLPPGRA
jgi:hypothetical protein